MYSILIQIYHLLLQLTHSSFLPVSGSLSCSSVFQFPPQRLLFRAKVREALSLARLGQNRARPLRAGPLLARHHDRQSPACRGSGDSSGLAGQKEYFRGPGGQALCP